LKKLLVVGVIVLFLSVSVIPSTGITDVKQIVMPTTSGDTLYVGGNGTGNYTKIQDAIADSENGDTIFVFNGTYYEHFAINKSLTLIGEDKYSTIIDGEGNAHVMDFKTNWINVSGFTIRNTRDWANDCGIHISDAWGTVTKYNTITDNIFVDHPMYAISMYSTSFNTVTNNTILDCRGGIESGAIHKENVISNNTIIGSWISVWGDPKSVIVSNNYLINGWIMVSQGSNNTVINNVIENGSKILLNWDTTNNIVENNHLISSESIVLDESIQNIIRNNTFTDSLGISIIGEKLEYWDTHIIENNVINGKPICYYKREDGVTIPTDAAQIILANCKNCVITNYNFSDGWGLQLGFSIGNILCENHITGAIDSGIRLFESSKNNISNNILRNNAYDGIELGGKSIDNIISQNMIINNGEDGIHLNEDSSNNKIFQNTIQYNQDDGIQVLGKSNLIYNNILYNNTDCGFICAGSFNNFNKNHVSNNSIGVWLYYTKFTKVKENNLINNSEENVDFSVVYRFEFTNKWNSNYYDNDDGRNVKIIWGRVQTRFGYWTSQPDPYWIWIYRSGLNIDWHPAQEPYDIGV